MAPPKGYLASLRIVTDMSVEQLQAIHEILNHYTDGQSVINAIRAIKENDMMTTTTENN